MVAEVFLQRHYFARMQRLARPETLTAWKTHSTEEHRADEPQPVAACACDILPDTKVLHPVDT